MSYQAYRAVIDELCRMIGVRHPGQFYESADITAYGASFSLMYGGRRAPDHLVVFCDFGPLPDHPADAASFELVQALLAANLEMAARVERGCFSLNPASRHILFSSVLPLPGLTGAGVMQVLEHYAGKLKEWRETLHGQDVLTNGSTAALPAASGTTGQGRSGQATLLMKSRMREQ